MNRIACILFVALCAQSASADVYPVSSAAQISATMAAAQPGDTLLMASGTWANALIVFQGTGDSLRPIVLRAAEPGQVVITGASSLRIGGRWLVVDGLRFENAVPPSGAVIEFRSSAAGESHHCRLTNTTVVDCNPPSAATDYKWISLYGSHNRVDRCYMAGKNHAGTTLVVWLSATPNYHRIDSNYFGPRPELGVNGGETIRVGTSDWSMYDSYTTVEGNYFYKCDGEAEIISSKSCGNVYRGNTFVSSGGALTLRHGNRCLVEGNFFFGNNVLNSGGIRVIGEDHVVVNNYMADLAGSSMKSALPVMNGVPDSPLNRYFQVKRALIAFNTLVDCKYNLLIGVGKDAELSLPPLDVVVANNVVRSTKGALIQYVDTPINMTFEGNVFYGSSLGIPQPAGINITDPLLQKDDKGMWRPSPGSPLIGTASGTYNDVVLDMDGDSRSGPKDVGADQVSTATPTSRPLTANDVGPEWMRIPTNVTSEGITVPVSVQLLQNFPNPFNPATVISYTVAAPSDAKGPAHIRLAVYDLIGREVAVLVNEAQAPGFYTVTWNAGQSPSGSYMVVLRTPEVIRSRKVVLLK